MVLARVFCILCIASALIPECMAIQRTQNGVGSILLFPFYSTEGGHDTYINIASLNLHASSGQPLAPILRVRFLDGESAEVVRSLNVYPTAYENWQAAITYDVNDQRVELRVQEGGCTIDESLNVFSAGDDIAIDSSVGSVEVYVLGVLDPTKLLGSSGGLCDAASQRWGFGGAWSLDSTQDLADVATDDDDALITGEAWLVNVSDGYASSYVPITLIDLAEHFVHTSPESMSPNLADADPVVTLDGADVIPSSGEGIDAVAMAISVGERSEIINDVITSDAIAARTDWVISYPLAAYKNYKPFEVSSESGNLFCEGFGDANPTEGQATVPAFKETSGTGVWTWGQGESNYFTSPFSPVPTLPQTATLCRPINVVAFGGREPILVYPDSVLLGEEPDPMVPSPTEGNSATLRWATYPYVHPEGSGVRRPIFGFRLTTFLNGTLNDGRTLGNYAVLREHRTR